MNSYPNRSENTLDDHTILGLPEREWNTPVLVRMSAKALEGGAWTMAHEGQHHPTASVYGTMS